MRLITLILSLLIFGFGTRSQHKSEVLLRFMSVFKNDTVSLVYKGKVIDTLILNSDPSLSFARNYSFNFNEDEPYLKLLAMNHTTVIKLLKGYSYCYMYKQNGVYNVVFTNQFLLLD